MPIGTSYQADPRILELGSAFYDEVKAADFPERTLRYRNHRAAKDVGLESLSAEEWEAHFARFCALPENLAKPLALRYHGHQFRVYNAALGDGRGFLFAQVRDAARTPARSRDQGQRHDAVVARRRRPARR